MSEPSKKPKGEARSRGLSDEEDILDTFDTVLKELLENVLETDIDPLVLACHIETYIANWQEQYK